MNEESTLGRLLRATRTEAGGRLKDYAEGVGITEGQLSRYERDFIKKPDAFILPRISAVYGLSEQVLWNVLVSESKRRAEKPEIPEETTEAAA